MKYQPIKLTTAQMLLVAMGWDSDLLFGHHRDLEAHPTKSGPGRKHAEGNGASRSKARNHGGAPTGFTLHKASEEKLERRRLVADFGRRQARKLAHSTAEVQA